MAFCQRPFLLPRQSDILQPRKASRCKGSHPAFLGSAYFHQAGRLRCSASWLDLLASPKLLRASSQYDHKAKFLSRPCANHDSSTAHQSLRKSYRQRTCPPFFTIWLIQHLAHDTLKSFDSSNTHGRESAGFRHLCVQKGFSLSLKGQFQGLQRGCELKLSFLPSWQ